MRKTRNRFPMLILTLLIFTLLSACAHAGSFQGFEQGVLRIVQPDKVWIYRPGSTSNRRYVRIMHLDMRILNAQWYGTDLAVTWQNSRGREQVYLFTSFTNYRVIH